MKTIRCRHKEGAVVVKIFIKPEPGLSLSNVVKALQGMFQIFKKFGLVCMNLFLKFIFLYRGERSIIRSSKCVCISTYIRNRKSRIFNKTILF